MSQRIETIAAGTEAESGLKRGLNLPLLALYGLGVTIGAGIYVLIGATAAIAGIYAPVSFLLAAFVVTLTGLSYAELGTRFPVAAGEAAYVLHGLSSRQLSLFVGLLVVASGVVSSAAISLGAVAYLQYFLPLPTSVLAIALLLTLGLAASWGIVFSVGIAATMTVMEIGGLLLVIGYALTTQPEIVGALPTLVPPLEPAAWSGIFAAALLAFFAFVGFEDIANVAEEVKEPRYTLPRAILLTLGVSAVLYLVVVSVIVLAVPMDKLARSAAPLGLLFENAGSGMQTLFAFIACVATINGVLAQIIMAARVLYGLAAQGVLHESFAYVHPKRRTPLTATLVVTAIILALTLFLPLGKLAEGSSMIVLGVFALVNLSLLRLKLTGRAPRSDDAYHVPLFVPALGFITCIAMLLIGFF